MDRNKPSIPAAHESAGSPVTHKSSSLGVEIVDMMSDAAVKGRLLAHLWIARAHIVPVCVVDGCRDRDGARGSDGHALPQWGLVLRAFKYIYIKRITDSWLEKEKG